MDEQQVEVESVGEDGEMDGAIKGILRAAAGEGTTEAVAEEGEGPVDEGDGKEIQEDDNPANTRKWSSVWVHYRSLARSREPCACSAWRRSSTGVAQVTLSDIYSISIPMSSHNSRITHKSGLTNANLKIQAALPPLPH